MLNHPCILFASNFQSLSSYFIDRNHRCKSYPKCAHTKKIWMVFHLLCHVKFTTKKISSKTMVEQYFLQSCFLLNSMACNHWSLRTKSFSVTIFPCFIAFHASIRKGRWVALQRGRRMVPFRHGVSVSYLLYLKAIRGNNYLI